MRIITGTITNGVTLAAGDSPVLIGGVITNDNTTSLTRAVYEGAGIYADIRNVGTIGDGETAVGISLLGGGTITNGAPIATHATIDASSYGLLLYATSTVTNYGSISGGLAGARFFRGGKIINGSASDTAALISGGTQEGLSIAVPGLSQVGTAINFGTIMSAGLIGINLGGGGQVINGSSADTRSAIIGFTYGVKLSTGTATVTNFGNITATAGGGDGVFSQSSELVRVINGSSTSTQASISGGYGIFSYASSMVTNFATITGTGASGEALHLRGGSTVVNGAATSTAGLLRGDFVGVYLYGAGRITNYGKIEGGGVGILLNAGGTIVNGSSTDKTALIGTGIDGVDVSGTGAATVTNFGTIKGVVSAVLFGGGDDRLIVEPGAVFSGAVSGAGGTDTAQFLGAGTLSVAGFTGFERLVLSSAARQALTLTNANFTDVSATTITVDAGPGGATLDASAVTRTSSAIVNKVFFVGGAGADIVTAANSTRMTGRGGANEFVFVKIGTNTITDFGASGGNEIVLGNAGFHLGLTGATSTPQALPSSLFVANASGAFTNTTQRFSYDTGNGQLHYDADGSGPGASHLVASLTGHPSLAASQLFFIA